MLVNCLFCLLLIDGKANESVTVFNSCTFRLSLLVFCDGIQPDCHLHCLTFNCFKCLISYICFSLTLSPSHPLTMSLSHPLPLTMSPSHSLTLSPSLYLSPSLPPSISLFLSQSSISLCLSHFSLFISLSILSS